MEQYKRALISNLQLDLKRLQRAQEREEDTLKYIRDANQSTVKSKVSLKDRKQRMDDIKQRIEDMNAGRLNSEVEQIRDTEYTGIEERELIAQRHKHTKRTEKADKKNALEERWGEERSFRSNERQLKRDMHYCLRHLDKSAASLPDYMRRNLREMPNNKGYIWRSVWFMGDLRAERNRPTMMFEKCRGGILRIYEFTKWESKIFEKKGKDRKVLISQEMRNRDFLDSFNKIKIPF